MKTLNLFITLYLSTILISCGLTFKLPIDKNKLVSNTVIKFTDKNFSISKDEIFLLSEKGLESNKIKQSMDLYNITNINWTLKKFKQNKYINYNITITNPKYPKPYFGKIAFFNTNGQNEMAAVSRYREISIDDNYFESSTRGRVAMMYEYTENNVSLIKGAAKVPTWIILMSDEPF
jgi:hypothetical protein